MREEFERERNPQPEDGDGDVDGPGDEDREDGGGYGRGGSIEGEVHGGGQVAPGVWVEGDDIDERNPFDEVERRDHSGNGQLFFDADDDDDMDGPDLDELHALEEMERAETGAGPQHAERSREHAKSGGLFSHADDDEDQQDLDEIIAQEEAEREASKRAESLPEMERSDAPFDVDEEMEKAGW